MRRPLWRDFLEAICLALCVTLVVLFFWVVTFITYYEAPPPESVTVDKQGRHRKEPSKESHWKEHLPKELKED